MITNQKVIIEKWLHDHGSITGKQAMEDCGVYRLSAVIYELRKRGVDIEMDRVCKGEGKRQTEIELEIKLSETAQDYIEMAKDEV